MTVNTRFANRTVQEYVDNIEEEDYSVPSDDTIRFVSGLLDDSFHRAFQESTEMMRDDRSIKKGVQYLHNNRLCGGFKTANSSLGNLTAFEQMFVVSEYIETHPNMSRAPRTYAFATNNDEVVPIWIRHPIKGSASLWTTLLGTTSGKLKAPSYEDMAETDPRETDYNLFVDPLTCLEMQRNPHKIGALAIKSASYDAGLIDHGWRFQNYNADGDSYCSASAELKKQKTKKTRDLVAQAAGYNLCELLSLDGLRDTNRNLLPILDYEDYMHEGYKDEAHPKVSPRAIVRTFPEAIKGNTDSLDELTARVFASSLGYSELSPIRKYLEDTLFDEDEELRRMG